MALRVFLGRMGLWLFLGSRPLRRRPPRGIPRKDEDIIDYIELSAERINAVQEEYRGFMLIQQENRSPLQAIVYRCTRKQ